MPRRGPYDPAAQRVRYLRSYAKNREKILARRRSENLTPEEIEARRAYHRAYYHAKAKRRYSFGVGPAEFAEMLAAQGGRCAICGTDSPGDRDWHLDHDHAFERRDRRGHRGILCAHCNVMLGQAGDNPQTLLNAAAYLADRLTSSLTRKHAA